VTRDGGQGARCCLRGPRPAMYPGGMQWPAGGGGDRRSTAQHDFAAASPGSSRSLQAYRHATGASVSDVIAPASHAARIASPFSAAIQPRYVTARYIRASPLAVLDPMFEPAGITDGCSDSR